MPAARFLSPTADALTAFFRASANPFTVVILGLSGALWYVGLGTDALFLASTVSANAVLSAVQETRAKAALRRLELLNAPTARIHRGGRDETVPVDRLRVGDHVRLERGDQVPADGILMQAAGLSVNEALLTGEADELEAYAHHPVYAGSGITAGTGLMRVTATGSATRAGAMSASLKWYDARQTPLQRSLGRIIRWLGYASIIIGILLYLDGRGSGAAISDTLGLIASGAVSIVPEGLVLASTLLLAYGAIRLGGREVLVQRIGAVEGFARLQVLCLDKTGTLTENALDLEEIRLQRPYGEAELRAYLAAFLSTGEAASPTTEALAGYRPATPAPPFDSIAFSSSRKYGAVLVREAAGFRALALGAPEVLDDTCGLTPSQRSYATAQARSGHRVLLLADYGHTRTALSAAITKKGRPVALISLRHTLRPDAEDTVFYLQANGVRLKVISGDALETVRAVARKVGIRDWRRGLTGDQLAELDPEAWEREVPRTTIFARVLPEQKERIIATLRKHGFTGMMGDGVNDTLALKRADLGISLADGSPAARQVADAVLLDNRFAAIPEAIRVGGQVILGVQMVACLFFNKIVVGFGVLALSYLLATPYPLTTRYLFLLNVFTIGLPALVWSLSPAKASRRAGGRWLVPVVRFSLANGTISGIAIMAAYVSARLLPPSPYGPETSALYVALVLGIWTVLLIPPALGAVRDRTLGLYPYAYTVGALALIFFGGQGDAATDLFLLAKLDLQHLAVIAIASLAAGGAMWRANGRRGPLTAVGPRH